MRTTLRFLLFAVGNGLSTAVSFLLVIVLARSTSEHSFVLLNLALTVMALIFVAGGGIDSAAVRTTVTARAGSSTLSMAVWPRVGVGVVGAAVGVSLLLPLTRTGERWGIVALQISLAAGISMMALAMIVPQARQRFFRVAMMQLTFYSALALGATVGLEINGERGAIFGLGVAAVVFAAGCAPTLLRRARRALDASSSTLFWQLVGVLTLSSVLFAAFDRVDLFWVTYVFAERDVADYGVAVRYASSMALVTGAFAGFVLPRVTAAEGPSELRRVIRSTAPQLLLILLLSAAVASVGPIAIPLLFGDNFRHSPVLALVMFAQFPLVAWQAPLIAAFPRHGKARWCLELGAILVVVKVVVLIVLRGGVLEASFAGAVAHVVGTGYALLRYRSMIREDF